MAANDPLADGDNICFVGPMTKLFYSSYAVCALLALLQLAMFFSAYLHDAMEIYHSVVFLTSGATSLLLLAGIFFPLRTRIVALLIFSVSTILIYVWEITRWPFDPTTLSLFRGIREGILFLIYILMPILGLFSSMFLLREHTKVTE